jgi:hypothetical protein
VERQTERTEVVQKLADLNVVRKHNLAVRQLYGSDDKNVDLQGVLVVDRRRIELPTSALRTQRSPS